MSEQVKKPIYKKWWVWAIVVVVVIGIASQAGKKGDGAVAGETAVTSTESQQAEVAPEAPTIAVTAMEYYEAYESNEVSADAKYKGKKVSISGVIDGVEKTLGTVSVKLKADEHFKEVRCNLKNESDATSLSKGQEVTLIGLGDGKSFFPEVEDCVVKK